MTISTNLTIEGRRINQYLGIVAGEAIMGSDFVHDLLGSIRDISSDRAGTQEKKLGAARQIALNEMMNEALELGANAVVGVDLDYAVLGDNLMMCSANGTAVALDDTGDRAPS